MDRIAPVIHAGELSALANAGKIVLVDVSAGPDAKENYLKQHLQGALFADLNTQLADIKEDAAQGGRHPLPSLEQFAETLMQLGIEPESHVVVYDDKNGANAAARFWWMLKAIGHEKVQVLSGGMQAAVKAGFPLSAEKTPVKKAAPYKIDGWKLPLADIDEVEKAAEDENSIVIDVRDAYRYLGESEPIDLVAGHIPGAVNVPFSTNLNEEGFFLSPEKLKENYSGILKDIPAENVIVHCGSGVTACHTLLAFDHAGMAIPKLYAGSWSEWSRREKPVAKGN